MLTPDDLTYTVDWDASGEIPTMVHIEPAQLQRLWKAYDDERQWGFEQQREAIVLRTERDALRAANQEGVDVFRCAGCGTWWDSGWPNNEDECPECGTPFPQDAKPTHRLVPIVA